MLKEVASKAAIAVLGAAVLSPALHRAHAQEQSWPAVRSEMLVSTSWLAQHLNDRDLVVLYVGRDRTRFDQGHIPGSRFVPLDDLVEQHKNSLNELPPVSDLQATFESLGVGDESRVVLTGDAQGMLAARVYFTLDYLGHGDHAALLDGGQEKWIAESRAVSREESRPTHAHFTPHVQPEILINTARMLDLSRRAENGSADYALLDARPVAEYEGVVKSEAVPKAGHIAGAAEPLLEEADSLRRGSATAADPTNCNSNSCAPEHSPGNVGRHLLPHRHAVFVHLFRSKVSGVPSRHVRRLGVRVGERRRQRPGAIAQPRPCEHDST